MTATCFCFVRRCSGVITDPMTPQPIRHPVRIIGIDPGLRRTGWGVIEIDGNRLIFVGCGSMEPPDGLPLASRLLAIHEGLAAVLGDFQPAGSGGRTDLRQQGRRRDAEARTGARRCDAGAGDVRNFCGGICAEPGEEDRGRRRSCRQEPDSGDAEDSCCRRPSRNRPTPPTHWRSRSPMPITAAARCCG